MNFLLHGVLPSNRSDAKKISRQLQGLVEEGQLFKEGFNKASQRCLTGDEVIRVFKEVHVVISSKHQGGSRLYKQMINMGYYYQKWKPIQLSSPSKISSMSDS